MSHTPGPWAWYECEDDGDGGDLYSVADYNAQRWANAIIETDSGVYGPHGDDRPLIAAAPDLLEALEGVLPLLMARLGEYELDPDEVLAARAAITKARGL